MPICLSVKSAASQCALSERTIHAAIKEGRLKVMRVGRRVLIAPKELENYLHGTTGKTRAGAQ
jgi:excisionase family DNA binding protein